jgi:hypothetical protein
MLAAAARADGGGRIAVMSREQWFGDPAATPSKISGDLGKWLTNIIRWAGSGPGSSGGAVVRVAGPPSGGHVRIGAIAAYNTTAVRMPGGTGLHGPPCVEAVELLARRRRRGRRQPSKPLAAAEPPRREGHRQTAKGLRPPTPPQRPRPPPAPAPLPPYSRPLSASASRRPTHSRRPQGCPATACPSSPSSRATPAAPSWGAPPTSLLPRPATAWPARRTSRRCRTSSATAAA